MISVSHPTLRSLGQRAITIAVKKFTLEKKGGGTMLRYRSLTIILLLCQPLIVKAQPVPEYFERGVPIQFNNFISCRYLSSAVTVLRRAHDQAKNGLFTGFQTIQSDGCTTRQTNSRAYSQIIVLYTLSTFKISDINGQITSLYAHGYRRPTWSAGRLEYVVTDIPVKAITK